MSEVAAADTPLSTATKGHRLDFVDALRGLVICFMVLDHVRDFVHHDAFIFDPLDLGKTSMPVFFTRWITHLCAPTFVFLSGVSIFLQSTKGKTGWALSQFLLTRGLWLIVLELTLVNFGFDFKVGVFLQVIYAIGLSMVLMAGMVHLPRQAVLITGIAVVAGHNLFDGVNAESLGIWAVPWHLLMQPGPVFGGFIAYPALPWFGIMCTGYGLGSVYLMEPEKRTRTLAMLAVAAIAVFLVLRLPNLYGNGSLWAMPANHAFEAMAIIDVTKYPPSLDYALLTLGISTLLGLSLQWAPKWLMTPLLAFGRTPFLTYLLHIYLAHTIALVIGMMHGIPAGDFAGTFSDPSRLIKDGWGLPLWQTYAVWIFVLIVLYPIASAYAEYRATHKAWWQSYL